MLPRSLRCVAGVRAVRTPATPVGMTHWDKARWSRVDPERKPAPESRTEQPKKPI